MPRRRSTRDSDDDERPTYLAKPQEVVDSDLDDRIAQGRELLAQMDVNVFPQPGRFEDLSAQFWAWHNYNKTYLERAFTTKEISEDYEGVVIGFVSGSRQTDLDRLRELAQELRRDINKLADIKGRLSLYEPPEQGPRPAMPPASPRRQQPIQVTFQGQVGQVNFSDLIERVDAEIAQVDRRGEASLAEALQQLPAFVVDEEEHV